MNEVTLPIKYRSWHTRMWREDCLGVGDLTSESSFDSKLSEADGALEAIYLRDKCNDSEGRLGICNSPVAILGVSFGALADDRLWVGPEILIHFSSPIFSGKEWSYADATLACCIAELRRLMK